VRQAFRAYARWRDGRPERHLSFGLFAALTIAALVAFPAQDLPVLVEHDLAVIDLSLVLLAAGTAATLAGAARRRQAALGATVAPTLLAAALALGAVLAYKAIGGVGWPDWWQLALGPLLVAAAGAAGVGAGRLAARLPRVLAPLAAAAVAIAAAAGGVALFETLTYATAPSYTAEQQVCQPHRGIRYCANPGYEELIPSWRRVTEAVLAQVPGEVAARARLVAQRVEGGQVPGSIATPYGGWARGRAVGIAELAFGLDLAAWAVGVQAPADTSNPQHAPTCTLRGQARAIVQMWLAAQASPEAARLAAHLDPFADSITGTTYVQDTIHAGPIAGRYAAQLLARPHDQVGQLIRANWNRLMETGTGYADAEQLLDLDHVGPTPAERENETAEASRHLPPCR